MRVSWLGPWLVLSCLASAAHAQVAAPVPPVPPAPAPEPTPSEPPAPAEPPAEVPAVAESPALVAPAPALEPPAPVPGPRPASSKEPEPQVTSAPRLAPWERAHSALTLEGRLGFSVRPESGASFDREGVTGAELGLSLYVELKRELAAGVELEHVGLGRGTGLSGLSSVSVDYQVTSALLGMRAYPYRSELLDVFVGLQVGLGIQSVSATGTRSVGSALAPAVPYSCEGSDSPALQLGGGIGARLMLTPRAGITARVNALGRRLSDEVLGDCVQGLGSATTASASLGFGYDFELAP